MPTFKNSNATTLSSTSLFVSHHESAQNFYPCFASGFFLSAFSSRKSTEKFIFIFSFQIPMPSMYQLWLMSALFLLRYDLAKPQNQSPNTRILLQKHQKGSHKSPTKISGQQFRPFENLTKSFSLQKERTETKIFATRSGNGIGTNSQWNDWWATSDCGSLEFASHDPKEFSFSWDSV